MRRSNLIWILAVVTLALSACDDEPAGPGTTPPPPPPDPEYTYELVEAFESLTFVRPVDIRHAGDGTDRVFVVEQTGVIRVFPNDALVAAASVFLDITGSVAYTSQSELGLLGLAFHPDYASNGYFFVYYTTGSVGGPAGNRRARLSRFSVSADPNVADAASERILLDFAQRRDNHNGGGLCFDGTGNLCLAVGDEGGGGDEFDNAQDRSTLHGSILRLDVDQNVNTPPYYGIPADNPFVGNANGYREEIFAWGMRNPWRISYDAATDRLWAGDVGQGAYEEIDIVGNGGNYGWDCREGAHAYSGSQSAACATATGLVDPVWEYGRSLGASVTGGYVYRGPTVPSLTGRYVFADYITGRIWALAMGAPPDVVLLKDTDHFISTFGVAQNGELLVAGYFGTGGATQIYRLTQAEVQP